MALSAVVVPETEVVAGVVQVHPVPRARALVAPEAATVVAEAAVAKRDVVTVTRVAPAGDP